MVIPQSNKRRPKQSLVLVVSLFSSLWFATAGLADTTRQFVTIGAGQTTGIYYPTARALCDVFNKALGAKGTYCSAEPTPGSLYNMEALARGEFDFAIVQADVHYAAFKGLGRWTDGPAVELRSVLSLYPEIVTIIARPDAGVTGFETLKGKRINIGNPGSGSRATWDEVAAALVLQRSDFAAVMEFRPDAAVELLCANELDVSIQVIGHPSKAIQSQLDSCGLALVGASDPSVEKLIVDKPYIVPAVIPGTLYGLPNDIPSFGGKATLVTTSNVSEAVVQEMAKIVIGNVGDLKTRQVNLSGLRPESMIRDSLTAPLHPGAIKAFQDLGLMSQ